jgi:hypothetical protein
MLSASVSLCYPDPRYLDLVQSSLILRADWETDTFHPLGFTSGMKFPEPTSRKSGGPLWECIIVFEVFGVEGGLH